MDQAFGKAPPVMTLSEDGDLDLEAIIAAKPDIVVAQQRAEETFKSSGVEEKLAKVGVPVLYLDLMEQPVANATRSVEILGKAIDRGLIALNQTKTSGGEGRGLAIAGIALSCAGLLLFMALMVAAAIG